VQCQTHREGGVSGKLQHLGDPAVAQKYKKYTKMHHFKKKNSKISPQRGPEKYLEALQECFPGPRCGSQQACAPQLKIAKKR